MASRGQSVTLSYYAWDAVNGVPKTGDVANHTLRLVKDGGTATAPTNAAAEIDATNSKGWYKVVLTSAETTADVVLLAGVSSTTGIAIFGAQVTLENLPTAAPNANAGLPILSSSGTTLGYTISTLTTYTGNTVQTGDAYARIGAAGAGLTAVPASGDFTSTMKTSIGTAVAASSVAGVTGVTFPSTVASPTNITAGTITTVTTLTNLPAITTDWLTGTGVAASAVTKIQSGLSTYAGGDTSGTTTLLARLTSTRAGLLDNLDAAISTRSTYAGGAVASVTAPVTLDKTQTLSAARDVSSVADTSLTINDALHCAIAAAAGKETIVSTAYTVKTPFTGTTLRIFTLDSATAPTSRT